jgi:hypothetical protein
MGASYQRAWLHRFDAAEVFVNHQMRKRLIKPHSVKPLTDDWLDVSKVAQVELTSEDPRHPIESALFSGKHLGWRAAEAGPQTIRLLFDKPQGVRRIRLEFEEIETARMQEFVLRWSGEVGKPQREIVRQQWNFSPPGTVHETEDYKVHLSGVTVLELEIVPDKSGGEARASLLSLKLAG